MKGTNMKKEDFILFSGGAKGAEAEFGANAEQFGIEEVNFTFDGHSIAAMHQLRNVFQTHVSIFKFFVIQNM